MKIANINEKIIVADRVSHDVNYRVAKIRGKKSMRFYAHVINGRGNTLSGKIDAIRNMSNDRNDVKMNAWIKNEGGAFIEYE